MNIRLARNEDIYRMHEILSYYIKHTAVLFKDVTPTLKCFRENILTIMEEYPVLVAQENQEITGFAYAKRVYDAKAYDLTVESTIYIDKEYTRKNIGNQLYKKLEHLLKQQNIVSINAYIAMTEDNNPYLDNTSFLFHKKQGFIQTAYFKNWGYKFNHWYDCVWMTKQLNTITTPPKEFIPIKKII